MWVAGDKSVVFVGEPRGHAAAASAIQKPNLNQIRLDNFFDRILFLMNRSGDGTDADGSTIKFFDYGQHKLAISFVKSKLVDLHAIQRITRHFLSDAAVVVDLRVVANAAKQTINNTRRAA